MSLCKELRSLLEPRQQPMVPYLVTLRRRLSVVGMILLNKVRADKLVRIDLLWTNYAQFTPRPLGIADAAVRSWNLWFEKHWDWFTLQESRNSEFKLVFCAVYPCSRLVLITETWYWSGMCNSKDDLENATRMGTAAIIWLLSSNSPGPSHCV